MPRKLWARLTGGFVLVALLTVVAVSVTVTTLLDSRFRLYLQQESSRRAAAGVTERIVAYYAEYATLDGIGSVMPGANRQGQGPRFGVEYIVANAEGRIVYAPRSSLLGQTLTPKQQQSAQSILLDDSPVGWVLAETPATANLDQAQQQFLRDIRLMAVAIGAGALIVAGALGAALSRGIVAPLNDVSKAVAQLADGDLVQTIHTKQTTPAEVASLAESFNQMSRTIQAAEQHRQRMMTDIAHELRTPVSVIRSQLQAMLDGVHEPAPQHIAAAYDQSLHLSHLIDDLRTLTLAEADHLPLQRHPTDLSALTQTIITQFEPLAEDAGVKLHVDISADLPNLMLDADRIRQVFANLLTNALRYTEVGGQISIRVQREGEAALLHVSNSGVTLTPEEAAHVFDRFWRADSARGRESGGSGLGLAITQEIVRLHGGTIALTLEAGHTVFTVRLPG